MDGQNFGLSTSARLVYLPPSSIPRCFRNLLAILRRRTVARVSLSTGTSTTKLAAVMTDGLSVFFQVLYITNLTHGDPVDPAPLQCRIGLNPAE